MGGETCFVSVHWYFCTPFYWLAVTHTEGETIKTGTDILCLHVHREVFIGITISFYSVNNRFTHTTHLCNA